MLYTNAVSFSICSILRSGARSALGRILSVLVLLAACGTAEPIQQAGLDATQHVDETDALIHGRLVEGEEHSATVSIFAFDADMDPSKPQAVNLCSGVRIRPDVILTAAHCFTEPYQRGQTRFVVSSASAPLDSIPSAEHADRFDAIIDVAIAEGFESGAVYQSNGAASFGANDIALGFLSRSNFEDGMVEPAAEDGLDHVGSGQHLFAVAYGTGEQTWFANRGAGRKRTADFRTQSVTQTKLVARSSQATACVGDSGAPLYSHDDPNRVLGILSTASANLFLFCKNPSTWTRVQAFEPWIQEELTWRCRMGLRSEKVCAARP